MGSIVVNIQIYKTYYLKSDENQYILYRKCIYEKGNNIGQEYEQIVGYFATVESACVKVLDLVGRLSNATTITELRNDYKACKDEIISNLTWIEEGKQEVKEVAKKRRTK